MLVGLGLGALGAGAPVGRGAAAGAGLVPGVPVGLGAALVPGVPVGLGALGAGLVGWGTAPGFRALVPGAPVGAEAGLVGATSATPGAAGSGRGSTVHGSPTGTWDRRRRPRLCPGPRRRRAPADCVVGSPAGTVSCAATGRQAALAQSAERFTRNE